ncbi:hypothetical protein [Marinimicrobium koreense]|uniref:hypothetical protein n=1 Tax=Marinimicrobium koreense TaxID=306545 RepID=UPI003F70767F
MLTEKTFLSPVFVALAALCWGLAGGIGGVLTREGWASLVVSFYRGAIGLLLILVTVTALSVYSNVRPGYRHRAA